jgi:hypothetical protein
MSVVYLVLGGRDAIVDDIITPDGFHVFSIYDFLEIVLISGTEPHKSRDEVRNTWKKLCRHNTQFKEVKGTLDLVVPSTKMRTTKPTADTTVEGLKGVLDLLGTQWLHPVTRSSRTSSPATLPETGPCSSRST